MAADAQAVGRWIDRRRQAAPVVAHEKRVVRRQQSLVEDGERSFELRRPRGRARSAAASADTPRARGRRCRTATLSPGAPAPAPQDRDCRSALLQSRLPGGGKCGGCAWQRGRLGSWPSLIHRRHRQGMVVTSRRRTGTASRLARHQRLGHNIWRVCCIARRRNGADAVVVRSDRRIGRRRMFGTAPGWQRDDRCRHQPRHRDSSTDRHAIRSGAAPAQR